jgi:hypothetical protein
MTGAGAIVIAGITATTDVITGTTATTGTTTATRGAGRLRRRIQ